MSETDLEYRERIYNTIYAKQQRIDELKEMSELMWSNNGKKVRFSVETKHWHGYAPYEVERKKKSIIEIDYRTMLSVLDTAIAKEREYIDKLIDMEVNLRIEEMKKTEVISGDK